MEQRKKDLLAYVLSKIFEFPPQQQSPVYAKKLKFDSYQDFVSTQTNFINGFDEKHIILMEYLKDQLLPTTEIFNDNQMSFSSPTGFYLSKTGKIIIVVYE